MVGKSYYERYWKNELPKMKFFGEHPKKEAAVLDYKLMEKWLIRGKTLDYGAGEGHLVNLLDNAVGVDISDEAVKKAKILYKDKQFFTFDTMPDIKYDNVVSGDVFEHIFDFSETFDFINSHLKVGGRLLIATNEIGFWKLVIIGAFYLNTFFHYASPHIRFFTKKTLQGLLEDYGYKVIHYENRGKYFGLLSKGQFMVAERTV